MFQRALICTDFSDGLQRFVNCVPSLAASGIKQVVFLHVLPVAGGREVPRPDSDKIKQVRDRFSPALAQAPNGVEVKVEVQWGRPVDQILSVSKTYQSDLIMLGTASRNLLDEKLFGSTTMGLCQQRAAPTLILRPQLVSTYTVEELDLRCRHLFRYLLLPYDGSDVSNYLIQQVKHYAQNQTTRSLEACLLCWVVDEVRRSPEIEALESNQAAQKLAVVKSELEALGLTVETQVRKGNPITQILLAAQEFDISAIATSSGSLGKLLGWSAPSFAADILRRSWHPVLYFPPAR